MGILRNRPLLALLMLTACVVPPAIAQSDPATEDTPATAPSAADVTPTFLLPESLPEGTTLTLDGSVSMETINRSLLQRFQDLFPTVTVTEQQQGTATALQSVIAGTTDLAAIGRPLTDEERAAGIVEVPISREKIAIIIGRDNAFQGDVTFEQFAQIFRGEIVNWSELGGPDLPIRFIDRPADSDTRLALQGYDIFQTQAFSTGPNAVTLDTDSTANVVEALGNDGISYAIASQVLGQDNVQVVTMNTVLPDDPRYPYSQPRGYAYLGTPTPAVEAFLAFATTPEGQAVVAQAKAAEAAEVATADLPSLVTAIRPNGEGLVTGDRAGTLTFWQADGSPAGEPVVGTHIGPVTALGFTPDGQRLISGGADGVIRFWDAIGTPVGDPINAGNGPVTAILTKADGSFVTANGNGTLQRWDNLGNPTGGPITGHGDTVRDLAIAADGETLVSASADGTVRLWNVDGSPKLEPLTGHTGPVTAIATLPDGTLVSGGEDGTLRRWDANGAPLGEPISQPGPVADIAISPDGSTLAVGDQTGTLQQFNADGTPQGDPIADIGGPVQTVHFSPDGEQIIVSTEDGAPQIRDRAGQLIPNLGEPPAEDDGDTLADSNVDQILETLRRLPPQVWVIIPVIVLGLLLLGLLRSWQKDESDLDEPEADLRLPPSAMPENEGSPGAIAGLDATTASASLDSDLSRAKAALANGATLAKSGQFQEALDAFNQAIDAADVERLKAIAAGAGEIGSGAIIARSLARRGMILANLKRPETALQSFERALEMEANDLDAWIGKGNLLLEMGRLDEALFCFDKAIELNPNLGAAWHGKGQTLKKLHRDAESRVALARAEELGGPNTEIPMTFGATAVGAGAGAALGLGAAALGQFANRPVAVVPEPPAPPEPPRPPVAAIPAPMPVTEIEDVPPNLVDEVAFLPTEPDVPMPDAPTERPISVPPEVQDILNAGEPGDAALPEGVQDAIADLPASPDLPDPTTPPAPPIAVPPEVEAILNEESPLPSTPSAANVSEENVSEKIDNILAVNAPPPPSAGRFQGAVDAPDEPTSRTPAPIDSPDPVDTHNLSNLLDDEGLPPELLAALAGIPEDSPDRLTPISSSSRPPGATPPPPPPPRRPPPPPPPSNPRLRG